jgi:hypothetical protein
MSQAAKLMVRRAQDKSGQVIHDDNNEDFALGIQKMVTDAVDKRAFEHISEYVGTVCNLAYEHRVKLVGNISVTWLLTGGNLLHM